MIDARRAMGGVTFWVLRGDADGPTLQVILDRTRMGPDAYLPAVHLAWGIASGCAAPPRDPGAANRLSSRMR